MPLVVANFPDPTDPANPLATAHVRITYFALDLAGQAGRIEFGVFASAAAADAGALPVARIGAALGQRFGDRAVPTAAELLAIPELGADYTRILAHFEGIGAAVLPELEGATPA